MTVIEALRERYKDYLKTRYTTTHNTEGIRYFACKNFAIECSLITYFIVEVMEQEEDKN